VLGTMRVNAEVASGHSPHDTTGVEGHYPQAVSKALCGGRSMHHLIRSSVATSLVASVCIAGATAIRVAAADEFANHTIRIVVPVPPGPLLDVVPRIIAEKLSQKWSVPVI